jgi:4-hydroxy-tetrahydrodipicolinate reductase
MHDPIRVLVLGTGQMGIGIARLVLAKQGLMLASVYARRRERAGLDLGRVLGLERDLGIPISADLAAVTEHSHPHIAIQATCSRLTDAAGEILTLVRQGVAVISIAEEMAYPACSSPVIADELHRLAMARRVAVLGTGVNPGFVLDMLVIALTGVCADIRTITAERINDLSPYGPTVLRSQGVGLSPEAFQEGLGNGTVTGHCGFPQSLHLIATAISWTIERIEQTRQPIISRVRRETPLVTVEPGQVAGCLHTAIAYVADQPVITLNHPQQIRPELEGVETGDTITITGTPTLCLRGTPEIPGGVATCALAVNMIPHVLNAAPGLHTMTDLPVPAALLGDVRRLVHRQAEEP